MKADREGKALRSEVANRLLRLGEGVADFKVKQALAELERQVLTRAAGPAEHPLKDELMRILDEAPGILSGENTWQRQDHLDRLREGVNLWQGAQAGSRGIGRHLMGFIQKIKETLSKTERDRVLRDQRIVLLKGEESQLEQKIVNLQTRIDRIERERADLQQKAAGIDPGSGAYQTARNRYDTLGRQLRLETIQLDNTQNVLNGKQTELMTLENIKQRESMPAYTKKQLIQRERERIELINRLEEDKARQDQVVDMDRGFDDHLGDMIGDLKAENPKSDFDQGVRMIKESRIVLGQYNTDKKPGAREPAQAAPANLAPETGLGAKDKAVQEPWAEGGSMKEEVK